MSPKRVRDLDLYLGVGGAARRRGEEPGRARQQLGITYIAANFPQAKGRVERSLGFVKVGVTRTSISFRP